MALKKLGPATCSPRETAEHPFKAVPEDAIEQVEKCIAGSTDHAGIYVVTTQTKDRKPWHVIIAVSADKSMATHGGSHGDNAVKRVRYYAGVHAARYGFTVNEDLFVP